MSDHPTPTAVELAAPGHYTLPMPAGFVGLMEPTGAEIARIRFDLGHATVLDIPLSVPILAALSRSLVPYLDEKV